MERTTESDQARREAEPSQATGRSESGWSVNWGTTRDPRTPESKLPPPDATGWRPGIEARRTGPRPPRWWVVDLGFGAIVAAFGAVWTLGAPWLGVQNAIDTRLVWLYLRVFLFLYLWFGAMWFVAFRYKIRSGKIEPPSRRDVALRAGSAFWMFMLAALFSAIFTSVKVAIPEILPFTWDAALAQADRFIHGGWDPWLLLQPVLGHPIVTRLLGFLYSQVYFIITGAMIGWVAWHGDQRFRMRFFLAFALTWIILGNVMAVALSSAGPVYYHNVVGGTDPFTPLLSYLAEAAPAVAAAQAKLWSVQMGGESTLAPALGISAAPSLHVAVPALFAMIAWRRSRWIGAGLWLFTSVMLIATVHLGWHYAIDAYIGVLGAALVLGLTDWLLGPAYAPRPHPPRNPIAA